MTELLKIYRAHEGKVSDRWSSYLSQYERIFQSWRDRELRLLEIGIQNGGSLEIWGKYFPNATKLVGCDIDPLCTRLHYEDPRIAVVVADASSDEGYAQVVAHSDRYDIVIDDGSHRSSHIVQAFARYFPLVAEGGLFVAEDLHCSYWESFEGGLAYPLSSMAFFKLLVDVANQEHWGVPLEARELLADFGRAYGCEFRESDLLQVHSVEFVNSMCVIRKRAADSNLLGPRHIVGKVELVSSGALQQDGTPSRAIDQSGSIWSAGLAGASPEAAARSPAGALRRIQALEVEVEQAREQAAQQEKQLRERADELLARLELLDGLGHGLEQVVREKEAEIAELRRAEQAYSARIARLVARAARRVLPLDSGPRQLVVKGLRAAEGVYRKLRNVEPLPDLAAPPPPPLPPTQGATVQPGALAVPEQFAGWISAFEPTAAELEAQARAAPPHNAARPLFSIVLPVYRVPTGVLRATLASVTGQTWRDWEVCVAFAEEPGSENHLLLQELAAADPRIRIEVLADNGGISRNSNAALAIARGEFVALLDHDDELTPWALHDMAQAIARHPEADFLYSDKDSINADGTVRQNPLFKPGWSPEMLYSVNYLTHLNVMRRGLVVRVGGWRPETDGAQDWDIFIRVSEVAREIRRVPGVGYHWRIIEGSTSTGISAKPYAAAAQLRTLKDWVYRQSLPASVSPHGESGFRVNWDLPYDARVDVVLHGEAEPAKLRSILALLRQDLGEQLGAVSFVRAGASAGAPALLAGEEGVQEFRCAERALAATVRQAVAAGSAPVVLLLDAAVRNWVPGSLREISAWAMLHPEIGFAAPLLLDSANVVVEAGRVVGDANRTQPLFHRSPLRQWGAFGGPLWYRNVSAASPSALAIKRSAWAGDAFTGAALLDACTALCARARDAGLRGVVTPHARVFVARPGKAAAGDYDPGFARDPYFHPSFGSVVPMMLKTRRDAA